MQYYLLRTDNTWSDLAEYTNTPEPRGDGTWIQGEPNGLTPYSPISVADQLASVLDAQPLAIRAQFSPLKAAISLELQQGNIDVARAIIEGTIIPIELEPARQQLLTILG